MSETSRVAAITKHDPIPVTERGFMRLAATYSDLLQLAITMERENEDLRTGLVALLRAAEAARWPLTAEQMAPMNQARAALRSAPSVEPDKWRDNGGLDMMRDYVRAKDGE